MIVFLRILFTVVLVARLALTIWAGSQRNLPDHGSRQHRHAAYVLLQLFGMPAGGSMEQLLLLKKTA